MAFKELKDDFSKLALDDFVNDELFRYWWLRLLLELNDNLASVSMDLREIKKSHVEVMKAQAGLLAAQLRLVELSERNAPQK